MRRLLPAAAAALAAALVAAAPAAAGGRVAVVVSPPFDPAQYASRGAVGLLVPGAGATVSRAGALAALVRGKVRTSLLGGIAQGEPLIRLSRGPAAVTIYVALPPPGTHHNVTRYPIAVVGGGYHGILTSTATRIPGLVSIADVAPTAVALERGGSAPIRSRPDATAAADLRRLDARLAAAHDARIPVRSIDSGLFFAALFLALLLRRRAVARAGMLVGPAVLSAALALSALHEARLAVLVPAMLAAAALGLLVAAAGDGAFAAATVAFLVAELVVLVVWPEVNALASIGPHPDGGGRYYGVTNEVETLVLAPALAAAAVLGAAALPLVVLPALLLVGWSRAGADGGGLLVFAAAFAVLWLRTASRRVSVRRLVLTVAGAVAVGIALVGLDAATGGSSHVTHALTGGPGALVSDTFHRWRVSWAGATSSWLIAIQSLSGLLGLLFFGLVRPNGRSAPLDALLVGIALSVLVNDTPQDVLAFGALTGASLWMWERLRPPARSRGVYVFQPRPHAGVAPEARRLGL